ncbi:MAG: ribonucleotide reductase N-terminal alpha domain-containing protein [Gammaproteobacteria bacterium]
MDPAIRQSGSGAEVPYQAASLDIWDRKYRLKTASGKPVDKSVEDTLHRVARALADQEADVESRKRHYREFLWALHRGALPAGRILANAGAQDYKAATSTINCTVSGTITDSIDDILEKVREAGLTLKAGCGIGYEFSTLRPRGAYVSGAGSYTSGPSSFREIYDRMCFTIRSAGGRRGAQMAAELESGHVNLDDAESVIWRRWPFTAPYITNAAGEVACRVYQWLPARRLWDTIMATTYDYGEPGFILIDRYNELNINWFCEEIRATNPCGEQGLPPYGSCLLGSINLTRFVVNPFGERAVFDWDTFRKVVRIFTRMLDNVVAISGLPLPEQRASIERTRRHGMGFLGLGSALAMLGMRYGETESIAFAERVARELAVTGWETALELAREKGPAPLLEEEFVVTETMLRLRPEMRDDGFAPGDRVKGRILHARYSRYMQKIAEVAPELVDELAETGARFTHHSSIAPTGTIALSLANNVSNGIEPSFAHRYSRNIIREGRSSKERVEVNSYEFLAYKHFVDPEAREDGSDAGHRLPECFVTADDISPDQHIAVQAAAQRWIDSSISKTVNVPTTMPFDEFKHIYLHAYEQGLKGCTTFRFNPEVFQGVMVRDTDLQGSNYRFRLEDGTEVEAKGSDMIEYEGELHTAANLYDALKEGYYGRL